LYHAHTEFVASLHEAVSQVHSVSRCGATKTSEILHITR